ncbi:MAG: Gfo/Idh/MocA family oxidoreductase [Planctomycetaceae bacterium]|nr:Gfo/Idh/MocA family oxidoreductase [Planctomycetaceae bacterium]
MADCQIPAYQSQGLTPVAISSRNPVTAQKVAERYGMQACGSYQEILQNPEIPVVDIAVPPDIQQEVIEAAIQQPHIRGILAQKPLAMDFSAARRIVEQCEAAGKVLVVNQNMRYDQSVRACKSLLDQEVLGEPVFATIDMRAVPHWMPWQERLGWLTLRIMSIHHLDTFRYWFGTPDRVFASVRSDPRTSRKFVNEDGICSYILEYGSGLRACGWDDVWAGPFESGPGSEIGIRWRVEGTEGLAMGTIGWPKYPERCPSTIEFASTRFPGRRFRPRWEEVWFPDAFAGPMAELLCALEDQQSPSLNGRDNLETMALVDACYESAKKHCAVELDTLFEN